MEIGFFEIWCALGAIWVLLLAIFLHLLIIHKTKKE
jgi:hypothetical protein